MMPRTTGLVVACSVRLAPSTRPSSTRPSSPAANSSRMSRGIPARLFQQGRSERAAVLRCRAEPQPLDELRHVGLEEPTDLHQGGVLAPQQFHHGGADRPFLLRRPAVTTSEPPGRGQGRSMTSCRSPLPASPIRSPSSISKRSGRPGPTLRRNCSTLSVSRMRARSRSVSSGGAGPTSGTSHAEVGGNALCAIGTVVTVEDVVQEGPHERGEGGEREGGVVRRTPGRRRSRAPWPAWRARPAIGSSRARPDRSPRPGGTDA